MDAKVLGLGLAAAGAAVGVYILSKRSTDKVDVPIVPVTEKPYDFKEDVKQTANDVSKFVQKEVTAASKVAGSAVRNFSPGGLIDNFAGELPSGAKDGVKAVFVIPRFLSEVAGSAIEGHKPNLKPVIQPYINIGNGIGNAAKHLFKKIF